MHWEKKWTQRLQTIIIIGLQRQGLRDQEMFKAIELKFSEIRFRKNMKISFWLVTSDVCRKKIDDNSGSCILRS